MARALVHSASGYVVHVTSDATAVAQAGHAYVEGVTEPDPQPPAPWVVVAGALASAPQSVIDAWKADQADAKISALRATLDAALADLEGSTSQQLAQRAKAMATALRAYLRGA